MSPWPPRPLSIGLQKCALCSPTSGLPRLSSPALLPHIPQEGFPGSSLGRHFPCVSLTTSCPLTCPVMALTVRTSAVSSMGSGTMYVCLVTQSLLRFRVWHGLWHVADAPIITWNLTGIEFYLGQRHLSRAPGVDLWGGSACQALGC